jgi:hypothetical protein
MLSSRFRLVGANGARGATPKRRNGGKVSIAIRRDDQIMVREVDGEIIVLDGLSKRIHQFNRTASFIWRACNEGQSAPAIASALSAHFEVDRDTPIGDVVKNLTQLRGLNLLRLD